MRREVKEGEREDVGRFWRKTILGVFFFFLIVSVNQIARLVDNGLQM